MGIPCADPGFFGHCPISVRVLRHYVIRCPRPHPLLSKKKTMWPICTMYVNYTKYTTTCHYYQTYSPNLQTLRWYVVNYFIVTIKCTLIMSETWILWIMYISDSASASDKYFKIVSAWQSPQSLWTCIPTTDMFTSTHLWCEVHHRAASMHSSN